MAAFSLSEISELALLISAGFAAAFKSPHTPDLIVAPGQSLKGITQGSLTFIGGILFWWLVNDIVRPEVTQKVKDSISKKKKIHNIKNQLEFSFDRFDIARHQQIRSRIIRFEYTNRAHTQIQLESIGIKVDSKDECPVQSVSLNDKRLEGYPPWLIPIGRGNLALILPMSLLGPDDRIELITLYLFDRSSLNLREELIAKLNEEIRRKRGEFAGN